MQTKIRIGTRGSPLALRQTAEVRARLMAAHGLDEIVFETVVIKTRGDVILDRPLAEFGGKELFTKEIEEQLLDGRIDLAVHSTKDMPTVLPDGLAIGCFLPRGDVRDALISLKARTIAELPRGAVIGTSSLRRGAQIRHARPDLKTIDFRGNVQTRLRKLEAAEADATLLACAGLRRLGLDDWLEAAIPVDDMLPAVGQGAICVEARAGREAVAVLLDALHDADTADCVVAERAFLAVLDGSCRTPIAGLATLDGDRLHFRGRVFSPDGARAEAVERTGARRDAEAIGRAAGAALKARLPAGFFDAAE